MTMISVDQLRQLLKYDPETGKLWWNERPECLFATKRAWKIWNKRFSGKEAICTKSNKKGHLRGMVLWCTISAHWAAWAIYHGAWPADQLDHVNGDTADNRIANLREVDTRENCRNQSRPKHNTSGVCGVSYRNDSGLWRAYINGQRGRVFLGSFPSRDDAIAARKKAEVTFGYHENHGR